MADPTVANSFSKRFLLIGDEKKCEKNAWAKCWNINATSCRFCPIQGICPMHDTLCHDANCPRSWLPRSENRLES